MNFPPHLADQPVALAPMAGVTDQPFRNICREWGASYAVGEMLSSDEKLWSSRKSRLRMDHRGEAGPRIVQIAGADPTQMARAAQLNADNGAQVIDINMGCPAKKVCRRAAGSALLADEALVEAILRAVTAAVAIPVTLKFRTGPTRARNNALRIARIAEDAGIAGLALHGRSREDAYRGNAEHETVRRVKQVVGIPVLANGDIDSAETALRVLEKTGADGLLIGRGAQGRPWLFAQIHHLLATGRSLPAPTPDVQRDTVLRHIEAIHAFYGEPMGVRIARKHIGWYLADWPGGPALRREIVRIESPTAQLETLATGLEARCLSHAA